MRLSARRTLVVAVIATGMTVGGAASAFAGEPDDQDDIVSGLTGQLTEGSSVVRDALDTGDTSEGRSSVEEAGGFKEIQRALTGDGGSLLEAGDDLLDPVNEAVCSLTDDEFELLGLDPVEVLGDCPADAEVQKVEVEKKDVEDVEEDHPEKKGEPAGDDSGHEDRPDDDSGTVPAGGIETGGGGTATDGAPSTLGALSSGIALSVVAGSVPAWRRTGRIA